MLPLSRFY